MDNESQFIDSIYANKGKYDFIVAMLDVDVKEFSKYKLFSLSKYITLNALHLTVLRIPPCAIMLTALEMPTV